jgi:hypothetical protein
MLLRDILVELLDHPVSEWYRHDYGRRSDRNVKYSFMVGDQSTSVGRFAVRFVAIDSHSVEWSIKLYKLIEDNSIQAKKTLKRSEDNKLQFKVYPTVVAVIKDFIGYMNPQSEYNVVINFEGADDRLTEFYRVAKNRLSKELNSINYEVAQLEYTDKDTKVTEYSWCIRPIFVPLPSTPRPPRTTKKKK